jgi:oligopeptide/dipeptide ABC transporter ATP-binding protein
VHALDNISLDVASGESIGIVGETGSGKSTLGKAVLEILPPRTKVEGHVVFLGRDLSQLDPERIRHVRGEQVALIFQDPMTRLNPLMTIEEHFVEALRAHKRVSRQEALLRAEAVLTSMRVPESRIQNYPHEFSGGMRQRIMIALALVLNPSLLVADEPTTSLDVIVEAQILGILEDLKRTYKMSLLLITHNLGIVAEVCDRVAVFYAGKIVEIGSVDDIFNRPVHPYTRLLLQSIIHLETKELHSIEGVPPDLVSPPSGCRFHPRCPYAQAVCREKVPPLEEFRKDQRAACLFGKDFL